MAESTGLEPAQGYNTLEGLAIPCDTITPTLHGPCDFQVFIGDARDTRPAYYVIIHVRFGARPWLRSKHIKCMRLDCTLVRLALLVHLPGLEPGTFCLSGKLSNQLA